MKADEFMDSYKSFVDWYDKNEASVDMDKANADYKHYQHMIDEIKIEK